MNTGAPAAAEIESALDVLLGWEPIARSPQLAGFLKYVVTKTLAGEEAGIKAYSIAVDVFGRPQSFDPQSDPIVRVQARRLRTLIDQYYSEGGRSAGVRITLPVGRYVPSFERVADEAAEDRETAVRPDTPPRRDRRIARWPLFLLVAIILGAIAGAWLVVALAD